MTKVQQGICDTISSYTKIKKEEVKRAILTYLETAGGEHPVIEINLSSVRFHIGASKNTIALGKMLFFKILERSELFADAADLLKNGADVVAFYSGGALLVIYEAYDYTGVGGVFVKKESTANVGYVIEPIKHYLQHNHPVYSSE